MKEFFAGMAFTLIMEGVAAVVVVAGKLRGGGRMKETVKLIARTVGVLLDIFIIFRKKK